MYRRFKIDKNLVQIFSLCMNWCIFVKKKKNGKECFCDSIIRILKYIGIYYVCIDSYRTLNSIKYNFFCEKSR